MSHDHKGGHHHENSSGDGGANQHTGGDHSANEAMRQRGVEPTKGDGGAVDNVKGNVHETKESLGKATDAIGDLMSGKGNAVDTALAVKGAFDAVKGISGKISESVMMPVMKALSAFKGQAILPAAKQMDPVMGIDVHMVTIPPSPAPIPMPHPYIGMLFNSRDFVSCAINTFKKDALDALPPPAEGDTSTMASIAKNKEAIAGIAMGLANMGASVKFGDFIPRAITGTPVKNIPHIPMGAGFFPAFDAAIAKNDGKAFLGSLFVVADGDPMVGSFHLNYDCWDIGVVDLFKALRGGGKIKEPEEPETKIELFVPSGVVTPIPLGRPVLVNSIPTPINPLAILDKLFKAGLGKLAKKAGEALINIAKNTKAGKKAGCDFWTAASKKYGTGQSHPVDVSGGYFYTDNEDFKLPGPIPFLWERTWYSFSEYNGPLGYGWHHSYDMALSFDREAGAAVIRMADGRPASFTMPLINEPVYNRLEKLSLNLHEDGYYYATDTKGLIYRFTQKEYRNQYSNTEAHLLQSIANRNGFAIRFEYSYRGILTQITDSAGRILSVKNDGEGHITGIYAPHPDTAGETFPITRYAYSDEGDMLSHTDALDQAMYFEYINHLMSKEIWRNGCNWHFRYNKPSGRDAKCIEVWGDGDLLHYKFDYTNPQCTLVTNSLGNLKRFYHKNGVVIKYVDPLGAEWKCRYSRYNELEVEIDPLGNQISITYDDFGNEQTITDANGAFSQASYGSGFLKHHTIKLLDRAGGQWNWEYDAAANLIKHTSSLGAISKYEYSDGMLKSIVQDGGIKVFFEYDTFYNMVSMSLSNGYTLQWSYDQLGNCVHSFDSGGNSSKVQFDLLSNPTMIHELDGSIRYIMYDAGSNITNISDQYNDVEFSYNYLNKVSVRNQLGKKVYFNYDSEGNLSSIINEHKELYSYKLDAADRIVMEMGFDGKALHYIRNLAGQIVRIKRPENKHTNYCYNETGKVIKITYNDNYFEEFTYSKDDLLIAAANNNSKVEFERDVAGRIIKEANRESIITSQYDFLNNRIQVQSSKGANIINEFDDYGNILSISSNGWFDRKRYDQSGFELERHLPGNINCRWTRDRKGRPLRQIVSKENQSLNNKQYWWNSAYQLEKIMDSKTGTTQFIHDEIGNLSRTVNNETELLRNPDAVGNLFNSVKRNDRKYSNGGKLNKIGTTSFKYDLEGNLIEKKYSDNTRWGYNWNSAGMLESVERPDGEIVLFSYDALGRRISKTFKNTTTRWIWDGDKPLHEWKENSTSGIILGKTGSSDEDGVTTWLFGDTGFVPVAKLKDGKNYSIIADHIGSPCQMYNEEGDLFWEARLDCYGKIKMFKGDPGSCPFRYQGQYEDVETGLCYNRFRYYDSESGCYISQDPIGFLGSEMNFYSYVRDPNIFVDIFGLSSTDELAGNMDDAGRPVGPGQTAHHIVKQNDNRNPYAGKSRDLLARNGMSVEDHENGARLTGTHNPAGRNAARAAGTYHAGEHIHSVANDKLIYRILKTAERKGGAAGVRAALADIGKRMENGEWMKNFRGCKQ